MKGIVRRSFLTNGHRARAQAPNIFHMGQSMQVTIFSVFSSSKSYTEYRRKGYIIIEYGVSSLIRIIVSESVHLHQKSMNNIVRCLHMLTAAINVPRLLTFRTRYITWRRRPNGLRDAKRAVIQEGCVLLDKF